MAEHLVIVGGGQAAAQAVQSLRQQSFAGAITLVCDEPYPPYQRPPLSKKYFAGELTRERLLLRPAAFYAEKGVTLEQNARAEELDVAARRVRLRDGRTLVYDRLLLATGSRVRTLDVPGADAARRALPAHDRRRRWHHGVACRPGARVLLVGAGYIGLEVAAVARQRGFDVTVLEAADRVMARAVSIEVSAFYEAAHRAAGVVIHCGAAVKALHGAPRVTAVETDRRPSVSVRRRRSSASASCPTSSSPQPPGSSAATASSSTSSRARPIRTCSPRATARTIRIRCSGAECGSNPCRTRFIKRRSPPRLCSACPPPYSEVPWFWSDQYDLKLQIAGLSTGYDEVVLRGDPAKRSFAAFYLGAGTTARRRRDQQPEGIHRGQEAGRESRADRSRRAPRREGRSRAARGLTRRYCDATWGPGRFK